MTISQQNQLKTGKRPIQQQIRSYKAGEILFEEGSTGKELFIIQEGKFGIYKNTPDGQIELALIEKGGIIGEMSLLDNLPRSATVKATENSKVLIVNQMAFQGIIDAVPAWLQSIIKIIVSRLRDTNKRVDQSILRDKKRGLISLLLLLFPVHKKSINGFNGLDYELILIEGFFISRLRKKEIQSILEQIEKTHIIEILENKEKNSRIVLVKELEILKLYEEYLILKGQKKTFREIEISDDVIATFSNIAYIAQKTGIETEDGTALEKSVLIADFSGKDIDKIEKNLLELRRKNLINMLPSGQNDFTIVFKKELLTRIKKIREWMPVFEAEMS